MAVKSCQAQLKNQGGLNSAKAHMETKTRITAAKLCAMDVERYCPNLVTVTTLLLPAIYSPRVKTSIASAHTRIQNNS
jgi:hypothetical protein